jgi:hypothetical protein
MFLCEHGSPIDQSAYDLKLKAPAEQKEILSMSGKRFGELQLGPVVLNRCACLRACKIRGLPLRRATCISLKKNTNNG